MKKILFLFAFALSFAHVEAQSYISTNTDIVLEEKTLTVFTTPNIFCIGKYSPILESWQVELRLTEAGFDVDTPTESYQLSFTKAEVDAFTGAGTGDTEKIQNAIEQCVIDYLTPFNVSTTFTIN